MSAAIQHGDTIAALTNFEYKEFKHVDGAWKKVPIEVVSLEDRRNNMKGVCKQFHGEQKVSSLNSGIMKDVVLVTVPPCRDQITPIGMGCMMSLITSISNSSLN